MQNINLCIHIDIYFQWSKWMVCFAKASIIFETQTFVGSSTFSVDFMSYFILTEPWLLGERGDPYHSHIIHSSETRSLCLMNFIRRNVTEKLYKTFFSFRIWNHLKLIHFWLLFFQSFAKSWPPALTSYF